jgi:hypothetical protein
LNDLEENRDKCFNTLRKKLYKELKEFKKIWQNSWAEKYPQQN